MMGIWRLLGRLVKINSEQTWFITDESAGRLIYEEYDQFTGKSSDKSKFHVVKFAKMHAKKGSDGDEVLGVLELDLANKDMALELTDE